MRSNRMRGAAPWLALALVLSAPGARGEERGDDDLRSQVEALLRQNRAMQERIDALEREVEDTRDEARAAREVADGAAEAGPRAAASALQPEAGGGLLSRQVGRANFQLLDISLDVLAAAGFSDATDAELEVLQGGGHDPRQRGFTLQQAELSFLGAVDPYLTGEAHLVYFLDTDGESRFEIEEAFLTSQMLPFAAEEHGFQLEAGTFFTEYGRINPRHPHAWNWQDQPIINSRLFGEDGLRGPGVRVGWLSPLPWFSELHLGVQNAKGETMTSFLANDEVFEERAVGGRPFGDRRVTGLDDFTYLARWVNGFDLSDTTSAQLGVSALLGPNGTGNDGDTYVFGGDLVVKWRPLASDRGWPFVLWESEFSFREYEAAAFAGCPEADGPCMDPLVLDEADLQDWGLYTQVLWGFRRGWAAGVRYEYAGADGRSFESDEEAFVSHNADPYRDTRHRVSPLLVFHPSEFSRLRLQYNYDRVKHLGDPDVHSVWAGVEFLFGTHPAHGY